MMGGRMDEGRKEGQQEGRRGDGLGGRKAKGSRRDEVGEWVEGERKGAK